MKKILIVFLLVLMTGCGTKKMICQLDVENNAQDYKLSGKYTIYYQRGYVKEIKTTEVYKFKNQDVLEYFEKTLNFTSQQFENNYKNIKYKVTRKESEIVYDSDINYSKIKANQLLENGDISKENIKNNMVLASGMKELYESKGANCH